MPDSIYLAMTAAELQFTSPLPPKVAYMACHFSPYGTGLSNFPQHLPQEAVLILNDRTPIFGHDHDLILQQLQSVCEAFGCAYILLDFQRQALEYTALIEKLSGHFQDKLIVPAQYAPPLPCPVFLPPLPVGNKLEAHIRPWAGRKLWLDISCESAVITVTAQGSHREIFYEPNETLPIPDNALHCNYDTIVKDDHAKFILSRTTDHLPALMEEATSLGVDHFIGLYQQLHK